MKNTFDELAKCALYVCIDSAKMPEQWIYAVDDAWMHGGFRTKKSRQDRQPVFGFSDGNLPGYNRFSIETVLRGLEGKDQTAKVAVDNLDAVDAIPDSALRVNFKTHDAPTAKALLEWVKRKCEDGGAGSFSCGVCFCSFEYFWENCSEINSHANAVLFDLRSQVAVETNELFKSWQTAIEEIGINGGLSGDAPLGVPLYLGFKLGLLPRMKSIGFSMNPNHVTILTSHLVDVMGDYSEWVEKAMALENVKSNDSLSSSRFAIYPLPKGRGNGGQESFVHGLELLHKTFKNAASLKHKKASLAADMGHVWKCYNWGHSISDQTFGELQGHSWLPEIDIEYNLMGLYQAQWRELPAKVCVSTIFKFLKFFTEQAGSDFLQVIVDEPYAEVLGKWIALPTRPGVLFLLGLATFVDELARKKEGDEKRCSPRVRFLQPNGIAEIWISVSLDEDELNALIKVWNAFMDKPKGSGVGEALRILAGGQFALLGLTLDEGHIGNIEGEDRQTLRNYIYHIKSHESCDITRCGPVKCDKEIVFPLSMVSNPSGNKND